MVEKKVLKSKVERKREEAERAVRRFFEQSSQHTPEEWYGILDSHIANEVNDLKQMIVDLEQSPIMFVRLCGDPDGRTSMNKEEYIAELRKVVALLERGVQA